MKIVFFLLNKFSNRDYHRFGFDDLKKRNINPEAWDCLEIFNKNYFENKSKINTLLDENYKSSLKKFSSFQSLSKEVAKLSNKDLVIFFGNINNDYYGKLIDILNFKKIKYGNMYLANLPNIDVSIIRKIQIFCKYPKSIFEKLFTRLENFTLTKKKINFTPYFIFYSGKKILRIIKEQFPQLDKLFSVGSFNYDYFFSDDQKLNIDIKNKFAVFLDEDNISHPDIIYLNAKPNCEPEIYLKELNSFFDNFEKKTNLEVIIAGHPKGNYDRVKKQYGSRRVILNKTKELVKKSELTIAHSSQSISFAVLSKKPILFLNSTNYTGQYQYLIEVMSMILGNKSINISKKYREIDMPRINSILYSNYIKNYLIEDNIKEYETIWKSVADFHKTI